MHSALGLDDHACRRARDLAALGYIAVATDMFGVGQKALSREEAFADVVHSMDIAAAVGAERLREIVIQTAQAA